MIQSPAPFEGKSGDKYFNEDYRNILQTLINNTSVTKKFNESEFYKKLKQGIDNYSLSYKDILQNGLNYIDEALGDKEITFALSHGDFAPWNMIWNDKQVFLYDWESANLEAPAGIDLVHFLFQTGFLLKKLRGNTLLVFCLNGKPYQIVSGKIEKSLLASKLLLLSYLLKMAIDEDREQPLSESGVERRNLIKVLIYNCKRTDS